MTQIEPKTVYLIGTLGAAFSTWVTNYSLLMGGIAATGTAAFAVFHAYREWYKTKRDKERNMHNAAELERIRNYLEKNAPVTLIRNDNNLSDTVIQVMESK